MSKTAFVFSGQGAQYSGMGRELYDSYSSVKKLYDIADALRPGTIAQSFFGTDDELKITSNTQPCLYLIDLAAAIALNENGIFADGAAGFSLGEIAALAYGNAYSYSDGFKIVSARGVLMNNAAAVCETSMCAVLKLDSKTVSDAAGEFEKLYAVNFNSPAQTVVSGLCSSMGGFEKKIKELGGRCIPLPVSAAFHSPFMDSAASAFVSELKGYDIGEPNIPVYSNLTAKPYGGDIRKIMSEQIHRPVKWQEIIENMIADGYTDFIEVGAGKTLCGLIKKLSKAVNTYSVQDNSTLSETISAVKKNA